VLKYIIPSRVNSDVIENLFCQERSLHNGANTNPTFLGYCRTINSIILGYIILPNIQWKPVFKQNMYWIFMNNMNEFGYL
jgi:hypothetical protein